jgi:transposase, IS5 family
LNLLNEARKKLEQLIDWMHKPLKKIQDRPRTHRKNARKNYLNMVKSRRPGQKKIRRGIRQQLDYMKRNLKAVDTLLLDERSAPLKYKQQEMLHTIRTLYEQQRTMYEEGTHRIDDRIVSLHQPHVRPFVRGKVNQPTEFGAKVFISLVDGYAYTERISWDNFNESTDLILAVERYRERRGCYPKAVIADKIYRNRKNIAYCKDMDIRISGPALGRKNKALVKVQQAQKRLDESIRNAVEGTFGVGKRCYGLGKIMAKIQETSETMIQMGFYAMNLERKLRVLLTLFTKRGCFELKKALYNPLLSTRCYMLV